MTKRRIKALADYFYSAKPSEGIPFRICLTSGMGGMDLTKHGFETLLTILNDSVAIREDCDKFWDELLEEELG